jgi:hypothetical protein
MSSRLAKLTLALAVVGTPAWAAVIDFEGVPSAGNPIRSGTLTVDGFDFTSDHFHIIDSPGICLFGGCVSPEQYIWEEAGPLGLPITMTKSGGGTFSFDGFDADQAFNNSTAAAAGGFPNASFFDVFITFGGGGTTLLSFGGDNAPSFQTFGVGLNNVVSAVFSGRSVTGGPGGVAIDNISVRVGETPVPEPGTLLLLGAGMAALGRRQLRRQ